MAHLHTDTGQRQIAIIPNVALHVYINGDNVVMPPGFEDWTVCTTADADLAHLCLSLPDFAAMLDIILACITDNGGFPISITVGTLIQVERASL